MSRFAGVRWAWLACGLLGVMATRAYAAAPAVTTLTHAEAVQSGWNATAPPATGWVPVKLMDLWTVRWLHHDGVVWYRLHWNQVNADEPAGLLVDYVSLAGKVWVNGSLVYRDPHLTEPLSRRWIAPQYFLLDKPVLRAGGNTVLVRVSGLAAYQPGLGTVSVGSPEAVQQLYRRGMFWRYNIHMLNFAMSAVLGVLFLMLWLLRRSESAFGWYAITTLFGAGYSWNSVASSPWPFAGTDAWEAMNAALFLATAVTFCVFLLRFCERRWRRLEAILLAIGAASLVVPFVAPRFMGVWRDLWNVPAAMLFFVAIGIFLGYAVRTRRADVRVMAISLLLPVLASFRDLAVYLQWIPSSNYDLASLTSPFTLIGMGFAVAWRFSNAMRRVEGFNLELAHEVKVATARLSDTLSQQHTLALANAHANERLSLVRDLHDGFGGSLVGAIAQLEHDSSPVAVRTVSTLKELRDDLRLVIDTTTRDADTDLAGLVAPLRRRWSDRFETAGIGVHWRVEGIEGVKLGPARSLDLLRFLQEALTNVLKHSGAAHVDVSLVRVADRLCAEVRDDGCGFDPAAGATGAGLSSLRSRAARLGGAFALETAPGAGTALRLDVAA